MSAISYFQRPTDEQMDAMDAQMAASILDNKDADKSGTLSASELGVSDDQLKKIDADNDGAVSQDELVAAMKAKREEFMAQVQAQMGAQGTEDMDSRDADLASRIFAEKDADQSGGLSASELGLSSAQLDAADANGDGVVSEEELLAYMKSKREAARSKMQEQGGGAAQGAQMAGQAGPPSVDDFVSRLFSDEDDSASSTSSSLSAASATTAQRAVSAYTSQSLEAFIARLFGDNQDQTYSGWSLHQSLSLVA
jgi:Ca2+-binding EF-hand superfamily protein